MPIHDWTRPPVGMYHHFHQSWAVNMAEALNGGPLPAGYYALVDQRAIGLIPDILALKKGPPSRTPPPSSNGGTAVLDAPPRAQFAVHESDRAVYAARANRVAVRNAFGDLVAIVELVSPGNKDSRHAIKAFVDKAVEFLAAGIHLLVIDLFPPTPRDPQGIHKAIWDEISEERFELPADKRLTVASYVAGPSRSAYVDPGRRRRRTAVGPAVPRPPVTTSPPRWKRAIGPPGTSAPVR